MICWCWLPASSKYSDEIWIYTFNFFFFCLKFSHTCLCASDFQWKQEPERTNVSILWQSSTSKIRPNYSTIRQSRAKYVYESWCNWLCGRTKSSMSCAWCLPRAIGQFRKRKKFFTIDYERVPLTRTHKP